MDTDASAFEWLPSAELLRASRLTAFLQRVGLPDYESLLARSAADPAWLMQQVFEFCDLRFHTPYRQMLDTSGGIEWARWCVGGTTNIVLNCLDRHRDSATWHKTFLLWEGEDPAAQQALSYAEFDAEVCRLAGALRTLGIGVGDVVGLYMPSLPQTYIAFFAVLKIGAILMPLFSGFGPEPLATRLRDGQAKLLITADGTWRRGQACGMKDSVDAALLQAPGVQHVLVFMHLRDAVHTPMQAGRDHDWATLTAQQPTHLPTVAMDAQAPALLLYTSGTTGRPKGCVWTHVSFLGSMVTRDMHICGDFQSHDRWFFMSDMGWMVGAMCACIPSYWGASLLIAEGVPDHPDSARFWRLLQQHRVTYLGVSPTLVRSLMRGGTQAVERHDLSALRITCSGGEAWTEAPWRWFFEHVCKRRVPIINLVGGTEVGGCNFIGTLHHGLKPGSFAGPGLGTGADIVDEQGQPVARGQVGELILRLPSIGMTQGLWQEPERYLQSYWRTLPGVWVHGDFARRDADGLYYVTGRSDDTLKVAGKRIGPAEIESLLMAGGRISDAAAIGVPDARTGSAIVCVCVPMPGVAANATLAQTLAQAVADGMGASYRPQQVLLVSDLPKTRNMKVMRRVVRALMVGEPVGDLSSLVNPQAVDELRRVIEDTRAAEP